MSLILLRDQPGVGPLEWALEQRPPDRSPIALHGYGDQVDLEERAHDLAEALFGVSEYDLDDFDDNLFEPLRMMRDEANAWWASFGWDVTDGNGKQLLVMQYLLRPLVCVVKGLHSDAKFGAGVDVWAANLAEAAKRFKPTR